MILKFPNDYEKLRFVSDNFQFNLFFKKVVSVCEICSSNHSFNKCPFPFFHSNKDKIISKFTSTKIHERKKRKR